MSLEILYSSWSLFGLHEKRKKAHSYGMPEDETEGPEVRMSLRFVSVELSARTLLIKQSSLVDDIIDLCAKWSRGSGSVVAVLSPNKKFLSSVFIIWVLW